mmetsp:Transcript_46/g.83  ORF Transcript_46/g.83 Transcript_46/m.83 type:complete len:714 (+) Transcript_46:103-2244(+)
MVKLARIQTNSPFHGSTPLLAAQVPSSSFASPTIQAYLSENNNDDASQPPTHFYVNLSTVAATATRFLSLGPPALLAARRLIDMVTSPHALLTSPEIQSLLIFHNEVTRLLSPLDGKSEVGKFLCIGMNYVDHCTEQNVPVPTVPLVFSKFGSCVVGPGDEIPRYGGGTGDDAAGGGSVTHGGLTPHASSSASSSPTDRIVTSKLDYEVELGIVIGRTVPRFTTPDDAAQYIGGYTVVHDVSARDLQLEANGGQWLLGKCGDGYAPMGPVLATLDEFTSRQEERDSLAGAGNLRIECRLTRKSKTGDDDAHRTTVVQSSNTSNLVFSTPQIVSYLSKFMTLHPGDVIATGTPPGVGCFRKPEPLWLEDGDVVECEIEGVGVLRNVVVETLSEDEEKEEEDGRSGETKEGNDMAKVGEKKTTADALPTVTPASVGPPDASSTGQNPKQLRLKNAVAIVTGGARGIGYGIALRLALEGASLVVLIDMNQSDLDEAVSQLQHDFQSQFQSNTPSEHTPLFSGLACDVTDNEQVTQTFHRIATELSPTNRIDILVQSAGIVGQTNILTHRVPPSDFDKVMNVNVKGIFHGCHAVLPYMLRQNYGRIVNIASIAGKEGNAGMLAYSTSKAAVIGLTKTIGKEYAMEGITCNAIAPAVVKTKMVEEMPEDQVRYMTQKIPMQRCGTIGEIASLVAFVASEEASFTTGFCFDATGGRSVY